MIGELWLHATSGVYKHTLQHEHANRLEGWEEGPKL